jgi:hypothetical protein
VIVTFNYTKKRGGKVYDQRVDFADARVPVTGDVVLLDKLDYDATQWVVREVAFLCHEGELNEVYVYLEKPKA